MAATRRATRVLGRVSTKQQHTRRFHQSKPCLDKTPEEIGQAFLAEFGEGQSFVRKQLLDANQARIFSLTLDRQKLWPSSESLIDREPKAGTPLPAGYHNAYFTPTQLPGQLGIDGTDTSYNPEAPFTRRMWAGGSISWPGADPNIDDKSYLKVGDTAIEVTKVLSCDAKIIKKTGDAMLVVGVVKEFYDSKDNLCVVDNRNWVFREALNPSKRANPPAKPAELSASDIQKGNEGKLVREFKRNAAELFRVSALTFNAHRIHYDKPWAVDVEGHRDLVVHGPLNMISFLDFWRDEYGKTAKDEILYPKSLKYRATSPVYVEEPYRILIDQQAITQEDVPVEVVSNDGTVCMKGEIKRW
ncbi:Mesaconyl-C(4)-CoA hydratase [Pseudocercospora fuligena]|uniref:Mesaconyl-C(4)-CoA hydratase n=1 Tax=Pseudocercospora fuligena TaxID=685502 RepID=A0A8H6VPG1_9PEZI|nr:Mesaconyl-C(4)-CoA hydratase [Pseudocercospora fuligena]